MVSIYHSYSYNNLKLTYTYLQKQQKTMNRVNSLSKYQNINTESQRMTTFSQSSATPVAKSSQISNIIECLLCNESIRQSHMCPSCCKMFCEACIKNWIKNKNGECPSCAKPLHYGNLLNCSILGRQIQQALSKSVSKMKSPVMSASTIVSPSGVKIMFPKTQSSINESPQAPSKVTEPLCQKHQLKLEYFCQPCKLCLCSDCAVLSSTHLGHRICKISQKRYKFKQTLAEIMKNLGGYRAKAVKKKEQIMSKLGNGQIMQKEKQTTFIAYLDHIYQKSFIKYDELIKSKEDLLRGQVLNFQTLSSKFLSLSNQLESQGKAEIVRNSQPIKNKITESLSQISANPVCIPSRVQCFVVPEYEQKTYILEKYSYLRQKGQILISQPLFSKGTQWRLKIFPGGINFQTQKGLDQYLAIHLQMSKGYQHANWYRFRIELVNQANRSKCMSFQFESQFKQGQQWHLDNFIPISTLYSDNFINPQQGYIEIVLYIRCLSYYHGTRDQQAQIAQKQSQINHNIYKIISLKKKASEQGIKLKNSLTCSPTLGRSSQQIRSPYQSKSEIRKNKAVDGDD